MIYAHKTKFVRAVDGDTVIMHLDLGVRVFSTQVIRLARVNTPELNDFEKKELALKAKAFVTNFLAGKFCVVETKQQDPYGRWVGEVWADGVNLSDELLKAGLAEPYPKP